MPAAKKASDICQVCQASFLSVPASQRRIRKAWAILMGLVVFVIAAGFFLSWKFTLLSSIVVSLLFGWIYLRLKRMQNLVKYLDVPSRRQSGDSSSAGVDMRHWSIDPSGAVQAVAPDAASGDAAWAREDEIVRRAVARARVSFAGLLGREFDFSPGVKVTGFAEYEPLRALQLKLGTGQARYSSIYALRPMRRVLFCEAEARRQLFNLETAICTALGYALFDTKAAQRSPMWLRMGANHLVGFGPDASESQRLNRAVRACLADDSLIGPDLLRMKLKQLQPYWRQSCNYDAYIVTFQLGAFSSSLVEFLATAAPADLRSGFVSLFRAAQQGDTRADLIERHLHRSPDELLVEWRRWVESRFCAPPAPTADVEQVILQELAPLVVNPQGVYLDRLRAIRTLGERGYQLGVDSLRAVVENVNDEPELQRAAVWSQRMIEGCDVDTSSTA